MIRSTPTAYVPPLAAVAPRAPDTAILWTDATGLTPDERPQLVFIGDAGRPGDALVETSIFGTTQMQLAARVFRHVRISTAAAARDARLAAYAVDAPVLLVATPDAAHAFSLKGAELTAVVAMDKMSLVTSSVSTDDLSAIVAAAERTRAAIASVDEELKALARAPMTDADRRTAYALATARRDALVTEFRSHFVLHTRTIARS